MNTITTAAPVAQTFLGKTANEWGDILLAVAIIGIIALAAYCGWQYWKKTKAAKAAEVTETPAPATPATPVADKAKVSWRYLEKKYKNFFKGDQLIATFDISTGKLYEMKKNNSPMATAPYVATEVSYLAVWLDDETPLGKIVVADGMAEYKPVKTATEN